MDGLLHVSRNSCNTFWLRAFIPHFSELLILYLMNLGLQANHCMCLGVDLVGAGRLHSVGEHPRSFGIKAKWRGLGPKKDNILLGCTRILRDMIRPKSDNILLGWPTILC